MEQPTNRSETLVNPPVLEVEELASATECTGLTPSAVQSPAEGLTYAELYAIHQQKTAWPDDDTLGASQEAGPKE